MSHSISALTPTYVADTIKTRLNLHSPCPTILSDFNHVCCCSADCCKSAQHQIVRESSSGSRIDRWGQADMSTTIKALFVRIRNAPKIRLRQLHI